MVLEDRQNDRENVGLGETRPRPLRYLLPTSKPGTECWTSFDGRSCRWRLCVIGCGYGCVGRHGRRQGRCRGRLGEAGRVEFAGARRVRLTCECSSMSCMGCGGFFLLDDGPFAHMYLIR